MPQFLEFSENCELYRSLARYGRRNAPLQLIGTFLSYAGNAMLNNIYKQFNKNIFYGNYKAVRIDQVSEDSSL